MKYSDYKKGYSALRRIINDEELQFSRQFAIFTFHMGERYHEGTELRGIYNAKTNNVIGFINRKNNVFFRPASIYSDHLLNSKNHVIFSNRLRNLRGKVPSHVKQQARTNVMATSAADRLIANDDKPNKVFLFSFNPEQRLDERFLISRIKDIVKPTKESNTGYALVNSSLISEQDVVRDRYKVFLEVKDATEEIKVMLRQERAKDEIAKIYLDNIREIAQSSILSGSSMNPLQFTYTDSEGELTGRIQLQRLDLSFPPEIPIREWIDEASIARLVRFEERVGSLAERGIDEQAMREERERAQEIQNQMYNHYAEMAMHPGANIVMPRFSSTWTTEYVSSDTPFGQSIDTGAGYSIGNATDELTRADLEAMAMPMPDIVSWDEANNIDPTTSSA